MSMMRDGTIVNQRDIVLIKFPFSDMLRYKSRPALIISGKDYNQNNQDVICCAVTSNPKNYMNSIEITDFDIDEGLLKYKSRVKSNKVFTLEQNKIIKKLCKLSILKSKKVVENLNINIKIDE